MPDFKHKVLELELRSFAAKNFEKPDACTNAEQIRFYVAELCEKIDYYKKEHGHVPDYAYTLLAQYNERQNRFVHQEFLKSY